MNDDQVELVKRYTAVADDEFSAAAEARLHGDDRGVAHHEREMDVWRTCADLARLGAAINEDAVRKEAMLAVFEGRPTIGSLNEGARLLDDMAAFIGRFLAFPTRHALIASTLWAAHTHALDCFESTPRLAALSPEPGSGKTRLLEVLDLLVPRPMHALNASPAAIFRSIEKERPTLLFDEVDALWGRRGKDDGAEDFRALLNAGNRKGATIPRCVGPRHDVAQFPVFAAVALAGLGDLPETLMTRSIVLRMRPRAPGEPIEPFRHRLAAPEGHKLRDRLATWAEQVRPRLDGVWPTMPPGITDRPADCWEALLAVADAAGGHWPDSARAACVELCKVVKSREASLGVRLLVDLRGIFGDEEALATETILERLHALDEAPWADLRGKPLDARGLAYRLRQYGISSTKIKIGSDSVRGYRVHSTPEHPGPDLWDAWSRYPSPDAEEAEPAEPAEPPTSEGMRQVPHPGPVPEPSRQAEPRTRRVTCEVPQVPDVPLLPGGNDDVGAWRSDLDLEHDEAVDLLSRTFDATVIDDAEHQSLTHITEWNRFMDEWAKEKEAPS